MFLWVALSACGTILLLSFTTYTTHDIAPVPLLWVIPLAIYLLTFILCFSRYNLYNRLTYIGLSYIILSLFAVIQVMALFNKPHLFYSIIVNFSLLFAFCMVCHGEIYLRKPVPQKLPLFYLAIATGRSHWRDICKPDCNR